MVLSNQAEKFQRNHSIILSTLPVELWNIIIQLSSFHDLKMWRFACSILNQLIFDRLLKHYRQKLFSYSTLYGVEDLIDKIYNRFKNEIKEMIEYRNFECFRYAAGCGKLRILRRLCTWYGGYENCRMRYHRDLHGAPKPRGWGWGVVYGILIFYFFYFLIHVSWQVFL